MWSYGTRLKARLKDTFLESLARKERQGMQTSVARKPKHLTGAESRARAELCHLCSHSSAAAL